MEAINDNDRMIEFSYRTLHAPIYAYILACVKNREDAEDMTQNVFIRLMKHEQMLCKETVKSFAFTIARNLIMDHFRHFAICKSVIGKMEYMESGSIYDAESEIFAHDMQRMVNKTIEHLTGRQKDIFRLSFDESLSVGDIAERLDISIKTVESHLYSSRKIVRNSLLKVLAS
jgi:RNA polymerase sigma-70 factor (family 1)